ncbi:MAG: twin-arginine translocation signal domain-containing protein [Treponemataceae bacterium]|nr:twin-arginine translocation signal domain-containing protein [Treponemataceae bacterium]
MDRREFLKRCAAFGVGALLFRKVHSFDALFAQEGGLLPVGTKATSK